MNIMPRGPYVDIVDRKLLAQLLDTEMDRRGLNQPQAAAKLAIPQGDISRLMRGLKARLNVAAFRSIARFLPRDAVAGLQRTVLDPEAREILQQYDRWLDEELSPYERTAPTWDPDPSPKSIQALTLPGQSVSKSRPWNKKGANAIFTAEAMYADDIQARGEIDDFWIRAKRRGFAYDSGEPAASRMCLAFMRVFGPISEGGVGTVELSWQELQHTGKLLGYLKAAFKRELILLNRPPALARAQRFGAALAKVRIACKPRTRV